MFYPVQFFTTLLQYISEQRYSSTYSNFVGIWTKIVSFTPQPPEPQYPLNTRLVVPQKQSENFGGKNSHCFCLEGINIKCFGHHLAGKFIILKYYKI